MQIWIEQNQKKYHTTSGWIKLWKAKKERWKEMGRNIRFDFRCWSQNQMKWTEDVEKRKTKKHTHKNRPEVNRAQVWLHVKLWVKPLNIHLFRVDVAAKNRLILCTESFSSYTKRKTKPTTDIFLYHLYWLRFRATICTSMKCDWKWIKPPNRKRFPA